MTATRPAGLLTALAVLGLAACGTQEQPAHDAEPSGNAPAQAQPAATATEAIAAFERNFGVHAGLRRNHTKGVCAAGEFVGDPAARAISRAALFSGASVPVVARFSLPGGNPDASDASPTPRGMALEFRLPDGSRQHMTMLNVPVFSAATPQSFLNGLLAATPDPATGKPDPERVRTYRESHPDTAPQAEFMQTYRPPATPTAATTASTPSVSSTPMASPRRSGGNSSRRTESARWNPRRWIAYRRPSSHSGLPNARRGDRSAGRCGSSSASPATRRTIPPGPGPRTAAA